jgi:putative oxidoreductase
MFVNRYITLLFLALGPLGVSAFTTPHNNKLVSNLHNVNAIARTNPTIHQNVHLALSANPNDDKKKETTWDRITGPKLFKTVTNWNGIHSVPLVPLRILTGLLMIHHGSEGGVGPANFGTPEFQGFIDYIITPYFGFLPGSPEFWSAIHDYAEFFGGICFALGFLTRPAALSLLVTMLSAVYFHLSASGLQGFPLGHVSNYSYDFEEPLLYALIFLMFWFNGAGPLSVDSIIYKAISEEDEQ